VVTCGQLSSTDMALKQCQILIQRSGSSRMAQCHTVYPSASPDLQIRIHHCLEVESVTCEDRLESKKRGASNTKVNKWIMLH